MKKPSPIIIIATILLILLGKGVSTYNRLAAKDEAVNHQWTRVENVLKRRADLIPNLANTVRGYAGHESQVLADITRARSSVNQAKGPEEQEKANEELNKTLGNTNVVIGACPELKTDKNLQDLQVELAGTENRITVERKRYSDQVSEFNQDVRRFPTKLITSLLGFQEKAYFEISEVESQVLEMSF